MNVNLENQPLTAAFAYGRRADEVARDLLGRYLVRQWDDGRRAVLRIVETEAYLGRIDRASHAWNGRRTPRNESMYLPGGHWYVYFIYGMHYCLNLVAGVEGEADAVLIRAGEAMEGADILAANRGLALSPRMLKPGALAGGPGKLCRALQIDRASFDALPMTSPGLYLMHGRPVAPPDVVAAPRIGVDYAGEAATWPLRFQVVK